MVADWIRYLAAGLWAVSAVVWAVALWYAVKAERARREFRRPADAHLVQVRARLERAGKERSDD